MRVAIRDCPYCESHDVRESRVKNLIERLFRMFFAFDLLDAEGVGIAITDLAK